MNDTYYELLVPQKKQNLTWLFLSVLLGLLALAYPVAAWLRPAATSQET